MWLLLPLPPLPLLQLLLLLLLLFILWCQDVTMADSHSNITTKHICRYQLEHMQYVLITIAPFAAAAAAASGPTTRSLGRYCQ